MGEKIKTLGEGKIFGANFEIELNHPVVPGQEQQVHIQTEKFRFELERSEYIRFASAIILARKNLKELKKIK